MVKKKKNYLDNKKFLEEIIKYKEKVKLAKEQNKEKPRISEFLGKCIIDLATNIATLPSFNNYPFKEDMIGDAILNCAEYFDNFDPEKSKNPYGYFTQFIFFAFCRKIQKEKKHLLVKQKSLTNSLFDIMLAEEHGQLMNTKMLENEYMIDLVEDFEEKKEEKKKKTYKKNRKKKDEQVVRDKIEEQNPLDSGSFA